MANLKKAGFFLSVLCLLDAFLPGAEVAVKVIQSETDLPEKFCPIWKKGDILVSDGRYLLLIGGTARPQKTILNNLAADARGSILSFVPAGKNLESALNIGAAAIRIKRKTNYVIYKAVSQPQRDSDGSLSFECAGSYEKRDWGKVEIKTTYQIFPGQGKIVLSSVIENTGTAPVKDLSYSLYASANHSYSFSPYHKTAFRQMNFRVYPKKGHYLGWLNPNPIEEGDKKYPGNLAPGETFKVQYSLFVDAEPEGLLQVLYQALNLKTSNVTLAFKNAEGKSMEVIVRELATSAVFFRTFLEEPFTVTVPLPEGNYAVRANFFPAVRERWLAVKPDAKNLCAIENPAQGTVKIEIKNSLGEYVPGKASFIGLDPTKTPYFRPENPRDTGKSWETFKDSLYPPAEGMDVRLPVGTYLVSASRGPEYTHDQKIIEILKDDVQALVFTIDKVIETPNLISLDPHLHTQNSDGQMPIVERLKSVVGEGVDVAVATDHNYVTDYAPALKKLGLNKYLAVILGSEVTKTGFIHYNTYPMALRENEENKGATSAEPDDISVLFNASRAKNPQAVLQLNHPRDRDLGYFNNFELDKEAAATAEKGFDTAFDLMEVMNGPNFSRDNEETIEDWLHLLNRGYYYPIMGSSDSHAIDGEEPGFSRTYIYYSGRKGDALDADAFFQALRKGRSFVSNGPVIDFMANSVYIPGDILTAKGGKIELSVKVTSAPWVSVDEVRLIVNGERKFVFPVKAAEKTLEKFRQQISLSLDRDAALVVEVLGKKTLYPAVQRQTIDGLPVNAVLPYALTNPIFVDVDGNGKFDAPWPEKIKIKTE
jgi:hypothetical protein